MNKTFHTFCFLLMVLMVAGQAPTRVKAGIFHNGTGGYEIRLQADDVGLVNAPYGNVQTFQITMRYDHTLYSPSIMNITSPTHGTVSVNTYVGPTENPSYTYFYMSMSPGIHVSVPAAPGELVSLTFIDNNNVNADIQLVEDTDPFAITTPNSVGINPRYIYDAILTGPNPNNDGFYQGSSLPVQLVNFAAFANDDNISLSWKSSLEINFSGYELQRSTDGRLFNKVAWVNGKGGYQEAHYFFEDKSVTAGTRYFYRLKMVDEDGSFSYSVVRSVELEKINNELRVFPNPAEGTLHISFENNIEQLAFMYVRDVFGNQIISHKIELISGYNTYPISVNALPAGSYFVEVLTDVKKIGMTHFIKK